MSTVNFLWSLVVILAFLLILCFGLGVRNDRSWKRTLDRVRADQVTQDWAAKETLARVQGMAFPEDLRYQIKIIDWGPDFTGEDGTLPRFRWVISDADQALRRIVGTEAEDTPNYLMLGNEHSSLAAWEEAFQWVEKQKNPPHTVVIS